MSEDPTVEALQILTHWYNGILTNGELLYHLSALPRETLELMPDYPPSSHPQREGLKEEVLQHKDECEAAVARGEKLIWISGGITRAEVWERAKKGGIAAQAILGKRWGSPCPECNAEFECDHR